VFNFCGATLKRGIPNFHHGRTIMSSLKLRDAVVRGIAEEQDDLRLIQLDSVAEVVLKNERFEMVNALIVGREAEVAAEYLFSAVHALYADHLVTPQGAETLFTFIAVPPERAEMFSQHYAELERGQKALMLWEMKEAQRKAQAEFAKPENQFL
jgi:hypothetical protein